MSPQKQVSFLNFQSYFKEQKSQSSFIISIFHYIYNHVIKATSTCQESAVSELFHWNTAFIVSLQKGGKVNTLLCILLPSLQTTLLAKINNKAMSLFLVIKSLNSHQSKIFFAPSCSPQGNLYNSQLIRYYKIRKLKRKSLNKWNQYFTFFTRSQEKNNLTTKNKQQSHNS